MTPDTNKSTASSPQPVRRGPWDLIRLRSAPLVAVALGGLLCLIAISLLAARQKAQDVYTELDEVNMLHRYTEDKLRRLRSDIHLSGIFMRDYLLDNSLVTGPAYRESLTELRLATTGTIEELERSVAPRQALRIENLRLKLEEYWQAFDPLFDWTPAEKAALSSSFLNQEVLPRREAVLEIANTIEDVNNASIQEQREVIAGRERELHAYLNRMLLVSLLVGAGVAVATVFRIHVLERRSERQQRRAEGVEDEMRRLSQQLVKAQEEERRSLSRELHDEVGQILTGLRMEVGEVERSHQRGENFKPHLEECKHLVESLIQTVRHLSMGLRPSMLDDLGLKPALEWQSHDFSKRYGISVNLRLEGEVDAIVEPQRTAVYRIVQEALTNCARHAQAGQISVSVRGVQGRMRLLIHDDGVGLVNGDSKPAGLGLLGIKERVRELDGSMSVHSIAGAGTTLQIDLPMSGKQEPLAHHTR